MAPEQFVHLGLSLEPGGKLLDDELRWNAVMSFRWRDAHAHDCRFEPSVDRLNVDAGRLVRDTPAPRNERRYPGNHPSIVPGSRTAVGKFESTSGVTGWIAYTRSLLGDRRVQRPSAAGKRMVGPPSSWSSRDNDGVSWPRGVDRPDGHRSGIRANPPGEIAASPLRHASHHRASRKLARVFLNIESTRSDRRLRGPTCAPG